MSGSGKSTVANIVARFIDATSGQIFFMGKDITRLHGKELRGIYRRMQMVFQSPAASFDPRRTLGDSIGEYLKNGGITKERRHELVGKMLQNCGLPAGYSEKFPHEISGGQCQRAAIARALAADPALLICDEATSALDVTTQRQIIELLQSLKAERNMSFLFICHNLALAQEFCDRLLVMHDGKSSKKGERKMSFNGRLAYIQNSCWMRLNKKGLGA